MLAAMNILWIASAFVLTMIESLVDFDHFLSAPTEYAMLATWSYLFPLPVVSWLHVGTQPEPNHLKAALDEASINTRVATTTVPALAHNTDGRSGRAIERAGPDDHQVQNDEAPIFNYARMFVWYQQYEYIR